MIDSRQGAKDATIAMALSCMPRPFPLRDLGALAPWRL